MLSKTNLKNCSFNKRSFRKKSFVLFLFACILLSCFASCSNETKNDPNDISSPGSSQVIDDFTNSAAYEQSEDRSDFIVVSVGSYITFGHYEQDNNTSNGKEEIEWLVLDVRDGKALLISKYALDYQRYNDEYTNVTWESCTLRKWLNDEFLHSAFSSSEIDRIPTVTVSADKNPEYDTSPGNATQDKVFLLSITEAVKYFPSYSERKCGPTDYTEAQGAYTSYGNCWWWLRSPGYDRSLAACVGSGGGVHAFGNLVSYDGDAVRPALWIDLNS